MPWLLHQAWPGSELHLVRTGHRGGDEMTEHMMTALNRFARTSRASRSDRRKVRLNRKVKKWQN